jgi:fibronectin-binding autotransporter adhesin
VAASLSRGNLRLLVFTGVSLIALAASASEAWAQRSLRDGGSYGGGNPGVSCEDKGGYEQDGCAVTTGRTAGGGGAGTATSRGAGAGGSSAQIGGGTATEAVGSGGAGGINGVTAPTLDGASVTGRRGGDGAAAADATVRNGGSGGAGGYGYVVTAAGTHASSAGQTIAGGVGGSGAAGSGTSSAFRGRGGDGGDGGVGLFLQRGGSFTNIGGATLIGGEGGVGGVGVVGGLGGFGGTGLLTSGGGFRGSRLANEPTFAADVVNAGRIAGGVGGASGGGAAGEGGIGVHLLGAGTLRNSATGLITGGAGGAAFRGNATLSATQGGSGGSAVRLGGVFQDPGDHHLLVNEGQIVGGAGAAGASADAAARAGSASLFGGEGGAGIEVGETVETGLTGVIRYEIRNAASGTITGGAGGAGGVGPTTSGSTVVLAGSRGGVGGAGLVLNGEAFIDAGSNARFQPDGRDSLTDRRFFIGTVVNHGRIAGGAGGAGGVVPGGQSGEAGPGGAGIAAQGGTIAVTNTGTIQGGDAVAGSTALGGAGIDLSAGSAIIICPVYNPGCRRPPIQQSELLIFYFDVINATIVNSGTIAGGLNGDGTRAPAIIFEGGVHTLRLQTGAAFIGDVIVQPFFTTTLPPTSTFGPTTTFSGGRPEDNTLDLDGAGTGSVSMPQFINFGNLTQTGGAGGRWTLTGAGTFSTRSSVSAGTMAIASGATLTTPEFTVQNGGTLEVQGTLAGPLQVAAGGTLTGSGRIGAATIAGTLSPETGTSIGTLTASGNIVFSAGSVFRVDVTPAGASDRLTTSGTITIQGGAVAAIGQPGDFALSTRYTILNASSISGTFAGVTSSLAFLTPTLTYDAQNAYLTLVRNDVRFPAVAGTPNQRAAAAGSEPLGNGNRLFDALVRLDVREVPGVFDTLSGEIHPATRAALLDDSRFVRDAFLARRSGRGGWATGYGAWGRMDEDGNAAELRRDSVGLFTGVDLALGPDWSAGFGAGYSKAAFDIGDRRAAAADVETVHAAIALGGAFGAARFAAGAAASFHSVRTRRSVAFSAFSDAANARYDARSLQAFAELSYTLSAGSASLEPFANLAVVEVQADAFSEAGGAAALRGRKEADTALLSTLGLRATARLGSLSLMGAAGWRHDFADDPVGTLFSFVTGTPTPFAVTGPTRSGDALILDAGLEIGLGASARLGAAYSGYFGNRGTDHGVRAMIRVPF